MSIASVSRSPSIALGDPMMADVLARVLADLTRTPQQRADIASAIRTLGKALQRPLTEIPADPAKLARTLDSFSPAMAEVSPKRWRNIMSLVRSALGQTNMPRMPARSTVPLAPKWATLFEQIPDKRVRFGLTRFARFCGEIGVGPDDVNDGVLSQYLAALEHGNLILHPRKTHRLAVTIWNQMASTNPTWPQQRLTVPSNSKHFVLPWSAFLPSLKEDVDAYLAHLGGSDPFADDYFRPLRPATVAARTGQLRAFISALVRRGHKAKILRSLADVVHPDMVKDGLRFFMERANGIQSPSMYSTACTLRAVAKYWVKLEGSKLRALEQLCKRLRPPQRGMTSTNRSRLRQFDDSKNIAKLLLLPETLMGKLAKIEQPSFADALVAQTALCVEFLLMVPLRIKNLAQLDIDRHLNRSRSGMMHLDIPGGEVKTGQPIETRLPAHLARMVELYVERYRPLLMNVPSSALFPGRSTAPKSIYCLRRQIVECVKQNCGIEMHPHLFRHLAAKLYLDENPGAYGVIRLTHGHASVDTTTKYYCGAEASAAVDHYDQHLLKLRDGLRVVPAVRAARKAQAL